MIRRKYANMRIYEDNIDFADVENTITYSLSAKNLENNLNKREEELCNKISDLEAKLAEKDAERELDNSFWKQECDSLQKTLAEKEKEILDIKFMMRNTEQALRNVPNAMAGQRKRIDELTKEVKQDNQDKISFAITELEKVRKFVVGDCGLETAEGNARIEISKYIKQQINELKGKVEDVKD